MPYMAVSMAACNSLYSSDRLGKAYISSTVRMAQPVRSSVKNSVHRNHILFFTASTPLDLTLYHISFQKESYFTTTFPSPRMFFSSSSILSASCARVPRRCPVSEK